MFQFVAQVIWPARCAACGAFVAPDRAFCLACEVSLVSVGPACVGCGLPLDSGASREAVCLGCRARPWPFSRAWAAMAYGGSLTEAILRFKHGGERHLARPLATLMSPLVGAAVQAGIDCLCPVPLHRIRLRQRGFNQALELLRVARQNLPRSSETALLFNELQRVRDTPALGHESPSARRRILAGAFTVARPSRVAGRRILVLDDVMTTGATLAECARVLLRAGAADVQVAALARTL